MRATKDQWSKRFYSIAVLSVSFTGQMVETRVIRLRVTEGAIHSTKLSGNFGPKLDGSVRSNRKSFEKTGPPFEVVLFSRSDRLEFLLNGSRPEGPNASYIKLRFLHSIHS